MTGFKRPDESYQVYQKQGRFYIEEEGFFSCIVSVFFSKCRERDIMLSCLILSSKCQGRREELINFLILTLSLLKSLTKEHILSLKLNLARRSSILNL